MMISREPAIKFLLGKYPYYVKVFVPGFNSATHKLSNFKDNDPLIRELIDHLNSTCMELFDIKLSPARMAGKILLKLDQDCWFVGFAEPNQLEALLRRINDFSGVAYVSTSQRHTEKIADYLSKGWQLYDIMDEQESFKVWIRNEHTDDERVAKFSKNSQIKHLQTPRFHVLCVNSEELVARIKLTFPSIDKIEHYIHVSELGETNE